MTRQEALNHQQHKVDMRRSILIREMETAIKNLQCSLDEEQEFAYKLAHTARNIAESLMKAGEELDKEDANLHLIESVFKVVQG